MRNKKMKISTLSVLSIFCAGAFAVQAQDSLSKKLANPLADLISIPTQFNYDDDLGPNKKGSIFQVNIQPVIPLDISEDWLAITRTIIPIIDLDGVPEGGSSSGMGDILESVFFSPRESTENGWIWGLGPALLLPTATETELGSDQWAAGPTYIALKQTGHWTVGLLMNHLWTFSGEDELNSDRGELISIANKRGVSTTSGDDINASYVEPWVSYAADFGTTFSLSAETAYDWNGSSWTIPLVATADHLFPNGPVPFALGGAVRYWAESEDNGPQDISFRLQVTLLFPQ